MRGLRPLVFVGMIGVSALALAADGPGDAGLRVFETRIRPLFARHCTACHGEKEQNSGLRLDTSEGILAGGDSGPAVVPGKPGESLLLTAVGYGADDLQMPPDKKLSDKEIAALRKWVELGAAVPGATAERAVRREALDLETERQFWSFQPIQRPPLPEVQNAGWYQTPLDRFVLEKLEAAGLSPAPPADKRTLLRRVTYDLTGLPPAPKDIEAFLADDSPDAWQRVVDRLLASPRYGERWGRHWLDVARYADSNGLDENIAHGNAWRYRDYVVAAFNGDEPFDRFVLEQLAGDLLPSETSGEPLETDPARHERLIATGYLSLGPKVLAEVDETKMEMDIVDEQIDSVGRAFLGLTLGCARCHDHKFDPLPTDDYYALAGIFKSTRTMEHFTKIARWWENPIPTPADLARKSAHERQVADAKAAIDERVARATEELKASLESGAALPKDVEAQFPEKTKAELKRLRDELAKLEKSPPELPTAMGVSDRDIVNVQVHVRGSHLTLGETVPRRFPLVLAGRDQPPLPADSSGRLALARWLVSPDHPLVSRVIANRIWRWHFSRGLVATTDNFGRLGERPTHPELLDWLAAEIVGKRTPGDVDEAGLESEDGGSRMEDGGIPRWSLKRLHRSILLSAAYRMSSAYDAHAAAADPENRLLWRFRLRRLEAEEIRDALLAVSGRLEQTMGGSMLNVANREFIFNHTSEDKTSYDSRRRSLYLPVVRNHLYEVFSLFDYNDASVPNGNRGTTTVAPQALFLMNGEPVMEAADALSRTLLSDGALSDAERVQEVYEQAYGRPASEREVERAVAFLGSEAGAERERAWSNVCQAVLASNEFVYIR
ncbi:MAG: PSD1 and planctomycete cytochrome C domain-containing protein [Planctomycetes bacterium]|nr:PSD1 and planctomycete cytochrome C domain-containing protein [Planctomycetota bacterium]